MRPRTEIIDEIEREKKKLAGLRCQLSESTARLECLHKELNSLPNDQNTQVKDSSSEYRSPPSTNAEKVALFRSLFRGREDVFPRRWENKRTGKSGYSPDLAVPFVTEILGVEVIVEKIDLTRDEHIVAICKRGKLRQRIPILDLPLPAPPPKGAECIEAFRRWRCQT